MDTEVHGTGHVVGIDDRGADNAAKGVGKAHLELIDSGFLGTNIESRSGRETPVEGFGDTLVLIPKTIPDLRAEVKDPSAYIATYIEVHQDRKLDIMEIMLRAGNGTAAGRPAAMHIVEFHLEMAVLMPGVAEYESAGTAQDTSPCDGFHVRLGRRKDHRSGGYTPVKAHPVFLGAQSRLSRQTQGGQEGD